MEEETEETQQYYGTKMSSAYVHFALSIFFVVVVGGRGGGGLIGVLSLMNKFFLGGSIWQATSLEPASILTGREEKNLVSAK